MNLVQEMFRLASAAKVDEAVIRLSALFHVMAEQPGFISAEALCKSGEPETLLVLHAWRDLADWQLFQGSAWKAEFMASRPADLYDPVPCGMNWRSMQAEGKHDGSLLRREVILAEAASPRRGEGVEGSQTYLYVDEDPEQYRGCTLRLSRLAVRLHDVVLEGRVLADELYESLVSVFAPGVSAFHRSAPTLPR